LQKTRKAAEVRKRLRDDFEFYCRHCVKIRTKDGETLPFILNGPQRRLLETINAQKEVSKKVRVIILKARQQGFSTFVHAYLYWQLSQQRSKKGLVVAHIADSTRALFDMYRRTHDLVPEVVRPATKYSSRKELSFSALDTGLMVATAGGDAIARGETITHAHLSEQAFWPKATASDNLNALLAAIPDADGTAVFVESTANGMSGPFYEMWKRAVAGESGFIPFFSPWFDSPEYVSPVDGKFERTYEEEDLVERYGLSNEQLMFRRQRIANTSREQFQQEYPSNADEAFIASGSPVFNPDQIYRYLSEAPEPMYRMSHAAGSFEKNIRGQLKVYHDKDSSERYYIGADVAMGLKGRDYSVAQVLDSQKRQVAVWRGHVHPDYFANILHDLGMYYNEARLVVENNNHGLLTAVKLGRDLAYPNVYTEIGEGQLNDKESMVIGFHTNVKTKPLIIDRLRAALREDEMELNDKDTLREMLSYIVTDTGKMEAEEGSHDDCVMSLALANHIHDGKFIPIKVSDDFYLEAI
jgi:hypothetical protein